jgi:hypothetical protein
MNIPSLEPAASGIQPQAAATRRAKNVITASQKRDPLEGRPGHSHI